jgi:peptidoglycan/LPS O-acetylase OafA/YrhL
MTLLLFLITALVLGLMVPRRWTLVVPSLIGALGLGSLAVNGKHPTDTPIPFLVAVCTLAVILGTWLRTRRRDPA